MKKILFFLFATLFAISVPAQNVQVLVGDPDINMMPNQVNFREGPIPGYYGYHNAAFLYTPADMQYFRGDIQSLAFQIVTPASWHANRYMKISMKEVDYEVLASTMVMNYFLNGSTVVFEQTNVSAESAGWRTFSFSEPFHYSGEKSLLVVVNGAGCDVTNAGWVNGCQVHQRTTPATNMAWIKMAAGQNINFNSEGADQSMMNRRFNTLFTITPDANLCYTPNDLNAPSASITNNSAVLQWTDCPIGMEYFIEWKAYSANWGENPAYTAMVDQGTETYTISNLLSNTLYNARIRTNCMVRNGNGDWVTINFRTDCGIITELPYFEDFDTYNTAGTAFATCWERYNDGAVSTSTPNFDPYTGHNSPPCVYFGGTDATLVSQPFIMDIKDFQVNLWVLKGSSTGTFEVGYLATPADPTTFVALETLDDVFNVWTQHSVSLSGAPEGVKQIAFRGYSYYLDDILVFEPDNFIDAEIVAITAPPTLGMNFTNEQVKAVVKNNAANPLSGFTLTLEVNDIFVVTENFEGAILPNEQVTYTFTALANISAGGAHTITVTVNAAGDVVPENNSKTITVTNQICPLLTRELLPLMENFDSFGADYNTDNFPECWQRMATTSWSPVIYPFQYFSSPNCLFMNQVSGGVSDYAIVVLPQIDPSVGMDELRLKFKLRGTDNTHPLLVGIMTNPSDPNSFELVEAVYNILQVTYEDMTVLFNQYTGTGRFIAFKVVGGPGGFGGSGTTAYIDDLVLELLPQCSEVANLAFSNVSTTSAMATWSDGTMGTPTSYTVEIRAAGTGTWTTYSTTNRSYIFTGLLEATKYEVRIFTNCGEMVSENYASGNFSTQCFSGGELLFNTPAGTINQNIPLSNFANYSYTQQIFLPGEFGEEATTIRGIAFEYSGLLPTLLKNNCKIYLSHTVLRSEFNNPVTDYIPFTTTGGAAFVEVYSGHLNMTYGWNYFYFDTPFNYDGMRNLVITVYDESGQAGGYDRWFNQHSTGNVNRTVYYYQGTFIDFRINPGVAVTAFAWNTRANTRFLVSCDAAPTCPAPNIVLQNITPSSIDANIVANGNETSWILEYKMDSETGWTSIGTVSTMPYTIDNLSPNTTYQVRARAICSGEQSDWATETVTTPQLPVVPATIPWYCDFEETFENDQWRFANFDIPTQNNWYIGTATNNGGTRSLYVSNTGGATNVFSFSIASTVWAYRDIEFPTSTNDFLLSFDVNVFGHSQAYYSEVFIGELIPVTASASFSYYGLDPVPAGLTKVGESLAGIQPWQTRSFVIPASLVSGKIQRLYFVWVNANHGMSYVSPPTALDNLSITTLTCNTPTNLAFSNLKHDCVDLTWNENGTATQWIVEYAISPFTTWIPVTVNQSELTGGVYTLSGLSGGTTYNVRVKAVCSASDISFSSNTVNFTTPCASLSIPTALEEFEAVPPNTCWTRFNGQLPAAGSPTLTPIAHNLQGYQYWSKSTLVTPHNAYTNLYYATDFKWLVTNSINLTGAPAQIEFDLFLTGYANANPPNISSGLPNKRFVVLISLDNGATWSAANTLRQWDNKGSQYVFNELTNVPLPVIIPLEDSNGNPYTGDVKIAFYAESTGIDGGADIDIHIDNFQVTVEEIEDPCMLKRADFPLIENFDSYSSEYSVDNYPECWQRFSTTGVFPMIYPFYFFSAPNCLFLNQYSGTISDYSIAILPQIDPSIGMDALRLKFKLRGTTTSQALLVGVMSDANDPNSFVLVETLYNTLTATYEDMTVLFDQYTGTGHYVAFKVMGGPGGFGGPGTSAYIDDLVLELMSPCSEVENLAFSNVSATSAMATWSDGIRGTPVSYTIEIREAGTATWLSYSTTEKSYIFTGLSEATKYEVQIWTSCEGDMVSDNYTSGIFYTKCLSGGERAFNTPAGNDNQNIPLSNFANYSYTQQIFLPNELGDEATTIRGISFEYGGLLPTTVKNNCIIYLSHTSLRSEFYNSYSDYIPFTTSGAAAFVEVYSGHLNMTPGWNTFYFDTPFEYNGLQNLVVTVFDASGQNDGSGRVFKQHNTGVNRTVYYYQGSYIDFRLNPSVAVTQFQWDTRANTIFLTDCTPDVTCPVPNVIIQNITATSIGVNIIANGTEDSWTLEYKQVSEATWTSLGAVSSMPYTIDNLTPNTAYQVRARAACSTFEADWVVHTVTTPFLPVVLATIPWICDFEDETENAQWRFANLETTPQTNWFIGSAVNNGGAQSMYISNTGGATNATIFGSAVTWTYRDIEFPASTDDFMLSFDIRVNGAENFYSAVFMGDLTPVTANVTGNLIAPGGTTRLGGSYHSINNWTNYSFVLPASEYAGKAQRLYFAWVNGAFLMGSPGLPAAIDNIAITILSCNSPANLTYSNLAPFSVDLSWTQSGDATEWIVEYQVSSASTWIPITVYQPSYTLTGLSDGATYNVRVKAVCGEDEISFPSNVITFTTPCGAATVPTALEEFFAVPPSTCWTRFSGALPATGNATLTSVAHSMSGWTVWDFSNAVTPHNARANMYVGYEKWLVSSSIDLT
ncbi:MAG: fibronectin type III domain-containing protein, partial [Lentimicrobiaceae bacterium]|nr:fibronectin type III domain-containing protein [Lentimicrobiaceae bacterium]